LLRAWALAASVGKRMCGATSPSASTPPMGPHHKGSHTFNMAIFSNALGEPVSLQFADGNGTILLLSESVKLMNDGVVGTAAAPFLLSHLQESWNS